MDATLKFQYKYVESSAKMNYNIVKIFRNFLEQSDLLYEKVSYKYTNILNRLPVYFMLLRDLVELTSIFLKCLAFYRFDRFPIKSSTFIFVPPIFFLFLRFIKIAVYKIKKLAEVFFKVDKTAEIKTS